MTDNSKPTDAAAHAAITYDFSTVQSLVASETARLVREERMTPGIAHATAVQNVAATIGVDSASDLERWMGAERNKARQVGQPKTIPVTATLPTGIRLGSLRAIRQTPPTTPDKWGWLVPILDSLPTGQALPVFLNGDYSRESLRNRIYNYNRFQSDSVVRLRTEGDHLLIVRIPRKAMKARA